MSDANEFSADARRVVLVIDDEKHMRLLLAHCLKRTGALVRLASSGEEAVAVAAAGGIDVVVLDFEMPGMNGVETLRALRRLPGGNALQAIMLTARGHDDYQAGAAALGVAGFFGKPFSPAELVRAVSALLAAERPKL